MRSSEILGSVELQFLTEVAGHRIASIFKGQEAFFLGFLELQKWDSYVVPKRR
jgi:hypothetical protein